MRQSQRLPEDAGIIPRAVHDIFAAMHRRQAAGLPEVAVYCSFVQIYNEHVGLALDCDGKRTSTQMRLTYAPGPSRLCDSRRGAQLFDMLRDGGRDNPLAIHEDGNRDIYVEGLSEFRVRNIRECLALLRIGA